MIQNKNYYLNLIIKNYQNNGISNFLKNIIKITIKLLIKKIKINVLYVQNKNNTNIFNYNVIIFFMINVLFNGYIKKINVLCVGKRYVILNLNKQKKVFKITINKVMIFFLKYLIFPISYKIYYSKIKFYILPCNFIDLFEIFF